MDRYILLNPGPVNLSERVRQALLKPDLCHREPEFSALQETIRKDLLEVYRLPADRWAAVLLPGSGTAAVEAMLISLVPDGGNLLIIENGVYGERMSKIAAAHGIHHIRLQHDWTGAIDRGRLAAAIGNNKISHIAIVQHETTTGRLNDLPAIATLCREHDIPLLVDGVSSFGAEAIEFDAWHVAACAATANKCLHGVPGVSFVIAKRDVLAGRAGAPRSVYLDLQNYLLHQDNGGTPFTQPVQCFYALAEALCEFHEQGGWRARQNKYRQYMAIIREGMIGAGIDPLLDAADCSCVLNAFHLPRGMTYGRLHDTLKANGFIIYAGQGELAKTIFRVSAMGDISAEDMHRFVSCIRTLAGTVEKDTDSDRGNPA